MAGGDGGGKLPAGFIAHGQFLIGQQGADAARQRAVVIDQCHQPLLLLHDALHAGRGALCFVFRIERGVQAGGRQGGLPGLQ